MWVGKPLKYDGLPHLSDADAIIPMLAQVAADGVSDISIRSDDPVLVLKQGLWYSITPYRLNNSQVERILKKLTGSENVVAKLSGGDDFDKALTIDDQHRKNAHGDPITYRFRLNATSNFSGSGLGFHAVLRSIPSSPPSFDTIGFPDELRERFAIEQGSFIIAGPTGSGKTTTFAACEREILEGDTPIKGAILTYEAPVEFLFHEVESEHSFISQVEIGTQLRTFAAGVRNAMRRKPSLIVIGELRDEETIAAAIQGSLTGHPIFGTTHGNSSMEVIQRLVQPFALDQQNMMFASIVQASRLMMSQTLVRSEITEKLVCIRDWIYLSNDDKERLGKAGLTDHVALLKEFMVDETKCRTMKRSIDLAYEDELLSQPQVQQLYRRFGVEDD